MIKKLLFAFCLGFPQIAMAGYPVYVDGMVSEVGRPYFPRTAKLITDGVDASLNKHLRDKISPSGFSIEKMISEQTALLINQFKAVLEQNKRAVEAQQQFSYDTTIAKEKIRALDSVQPAPDACGSVITGVLSGSAQASKQAGKAKVKADLERRNSSPGRKAGGGSSAAETVAEHNKYCDPKDPGCDNRATPFASDRGILRNVSIINADMSSSSLLDGAGNEGKNILSYTPNQQATANAFITHITTGAVTPRVLSDEEADTPAGRMYTAKMIEYNSLRDGITAPLRLIAASRRPDENSGRIANAIISNSSDDVGGYVKAEINRIQQHTGYSGISPADIMRIQVMRRTSNPNWYRAVATQSLDANIKELVYMTALMLDMMYQKYRDDEADKIPAAIHAMELVKSRMLPELQRIDHQIAKN